ncbi:MAG: SDR family NAD(P)-dependent oxidoreductase [Streptosporangiales bacterium]|nr:SDR family NAD(P)-dependent oxidoreductase [Streptosporangiales bacterium]
MRRGIEDSVAVITGASSGIARATALALAGRGASVVLAARSERPLADAVRDCERAGGRALAVPTDVTDEAARVYRKVIDTNLFGQIHGARAVLPYFREQASGVLINLGSVWGSGTGSPPASTVGWYPS